MSSLTQTARLEKWKKCVCARKPLEMTRLQLSSNVNGEKLGARLQVADTKGQSNTA